MSPLTLYNSNLSIPCRLVRLVAGAVGVDLKIVNVNPRVDLRKPEWLKRNPQHTVPVLEDNGLWLTESRAISMYIVSKYAKDDSLYPKDLNKRVLVDQKLFFDQDLFNRLASVFRPQIFGTSLDPSSVDKVNDSLESLTRMLEDKQWLAGENITLADYAVAITLAGVELAPETAGLDLMKYSNIKQWLSRFEGSTPQIFEHRKGLREALVQRLHRRESTTLSVAACRPALQQQSSLAHEASVDSDSVDEATRHQLHSFCTTACLLLDAGSQRAFPVLAVT